MNESDEELYRNINEFTYLAKELVDNGDHFEVPALARKMLGGYAGEPEIPDPAGVEPSSAWVSELVDPWRTRMHTRENTIPTPWDDFNHEFSGGGLLPKRICTIAAPTGFGKSVAGIQVATHAAENGYPAVIFSAEMDKLEVFDRIVARKARIPLTAIENRDLQDFNWRRYESTLEWFNEQPLLIDDTAPMSIEYVASALRHHVKHNGVKLAVIDYLQLLDSRFKAQSREQQVAYLSRQVKALVMELGITIVQLAQINRDGNVRESAQIENDSNVLIVMKKPDEVEGPSLYVDMAVVKNRNGRKGTFRLIFNGNYGDLERNDPKGFDQ